MPPERANPADVVIPPTGAARVRLVLILGALIALGPLTIDMYLPALPSITTELLTTEATVQLTLTGTLLGLALAQLVLGPLADAFGRKRPMLVGAGVHVAASVLYAIAPNIAALGTLRVLQGAGAAAGMVVALAIVRDLYSGRAAALLLSRLILVMGAAPIVAPTFGGALLGFTSWPRCVHRARALRAGAPANGRPPAARDTAPPSPPPRSARGHPADLGRAAHRPSLRGAGAELLLAAVLAGTAAGLLLLATSLTGVGGLAGVLVPLWAALFTVGLALPNTPALALSRHGEAAGTAAALLGAIQFGTGAVVSPLVGVVGNNALHTATVRWGRPG